METMKMIVIGDGNVGKSCFVYRLSTGSFPGEYLPSVVDEYRSEPDSERLLNGTRFKIVLHDTPGQEGYDRFRPSLYRGTHVFLVFFDVCCRTSFENVTERWVPEVRELVPGCPILLVGSKTDLRSNKYLSRKFPNRQAISRQEAQDLASSLGLPYRETSTLKAVGTYEVLDAAVHLGADYIKRENLKRLGVFQKTKARISHRNESVLHLPPQLLPPENAPEIEIPESTFSEDWGKMLEDRNCTDVMFVISGGSSFEAHSIFLSAASPVFREIFLEGANHQLDKTLFEEIEWACDAGKACSSLVHSKQTCAVGKTVITLSPSMSSAAFFEVVPSLYKGLPDIALDTEMEFVNGVKELAEKIQSPWLSQICENVCKDAAYLNPSIITFQKDETGAAMKKLFLNKDLMSDVKITVANTTLYAHRVVLTARCDVMAAMLGGAFEESSKDEIEILDTSTESFLALLEYLYTDHAPLEECDPPGLLKLADRFCLPRLVALCELHITKSMERMTSDQCGDQACTVIHLLLMGQAHNARQLTSWCLYTISTKFSMFVELEEFSLLSREHRAYVEEHRWPPLSYLEALREFKVDSTARSKCTVM